MAIKIPPLVLLLLDLLSVISNNWKTAHTRTHTYTHVLYTTSSMSTDTKMHIILSEVLLAAVDRVPQRQKVEVGLCT